MNIPIQNVYYLLCYAWDKLDEKDRVNVSVEDSTTLVDLFAKLLINATTVLIKRGLEREYIEHSDDLPGIKGKLDLSFSIKRDMLRKGRARCQYDDLYLNTLMNRILVTTLRKLYVTDSLHHELRVQLKRLRAKLFIIEEIDVTPELFSQIRINRNNRFYGFIMDVCRLIHESLLPTEEAGRYEFAEFTRDERKMNQLFEKFVLNFYNREQRTYTAKSRQLTWKMSETTEGALRYLPNMRTDISLTSSGHEIIIDTKYYSKTLQSYYDTNKLHSAHLYQLTGYLIHQEEPTKEPHTLHSTGILLYPTVQQELNLSYAFQGHPVHVRTVNLNEDWTMIHARLLEIIADRNVAHSPVEG